jgi:RNA 3'-terminal phosphate cyclase (ATP)
MIEIDGSEGEGGGQMLRSALSLSMCTDQAFRLKNIRAKREKPGLMRQHLTALQAAAAVCDAKVTGAEVGSGEITFRPGTVKAGDYQFAIGTAGSTTLVLQTVLPALLTGAVPSTIRITGGTHNKACPPVDFLQRAYLPLVERIGPTVQLELVRHGFYPRGGGAILARVTPSARLTAITLNERGARKGGYAEAYISGIPMHVASRELEIVGKMLNWTADNLRIRGLSGEFGPGNALTITVEHEHITEVFTGFGEKGVAAESVAKRAVDAARDYLASDAPVGPHLADQLLLPMAMEAGGKFRTMPVTQHFRSHVSIIETFLSKRVVMEDREGLVYVKVGKRRGTPKRKR